MLEPNPIAEKILKVAIEILARKGYHATSTREIVEAAGVTKPMLYYYFGSKAGVCQAGIRRISQEFSLLAWRRSSPEIENHAKRWWTSYGRISS